MTENETSSDEPKGEVMIIAEQILGEIQPVTFELLGAGRYLADKLGSRLTTLLLGYKLKDAPQNLIQAGADEVYVADHPDLYVYRTLPYRRIVCDLLESLPLTPHVVLLGSTTTGRDLAPRIASHFETGLTADCTELDIGSYEHKSKVDPSKIGLYNDCLYAIRPSFGESLKARILGPWKNPQMATTRPGQMSPLKPDPSRQGKITEVPVNLKPEDYRLIVADTLREVSKGINLAEADVIVSGGYGLGSADGFQLIYELGRCFPNSAVGASRKVVDLGWIPYEHQVGQTGKTVRPKLYIACGISGAIQHRVGMAKSGTIIAINKDVDAPIFKFAHHGIVGDVYQIIPEMIQQFKESILSWGYSQLSTRIEYDVLMVGGSPSNLVLAYHLLELAKISGKQLSIAILEKGKEFGTHIMSGAVSNPHVLKKVWPNYEELGFPIEATCTESNFSVLGLKKKWDMPSFMYPKSLDKREYLILTLSYVTAWMAKQVQEKAKDVPNVSINLFTGFSAHGVVIEDGRVVGVKVVENARSDEDYVYAKFTCFGDKGFISRDVIDYFKLRDCSQIWSIGLKEVWQCAESYEGKVWHTLGWPLLDGTFGGGFVYGMKDNRLTIGLVISLDSQDPNLNPQYKLQEYKKHPWIQKMITGGKLLKYGAATLPEGGYYALPKKFAVPGALLLGDALGVLDVKHLAGIDRSMECGYVAAEVLHDALIKGEYSEEALFPYQERLTNSFVIQESYKDRYFRWAFMENPRLLGEYLPQVANGVDNSHPILGALSIGLKHPIRATKDGIRSLSLIEGIKDIGPIKYEPDFKHIVPAFIEPKYDEPPYDKNTIYSRPDAVFYASTKYHEGNKHIDEFNANVCVACIAKYDQLGKTTPCVSDCTAEVHRIDIIDDLKRHGMSLENCIHCRTCEIICPEVNLRVKPTEQGSGPDFMGL